MSYIVRGTRMKEKKMIMIDEMLMITISFFSWIRVYAFHYICLMDLMAALNLNLPENLEQA